MELNLEILVWNKCFEVSIEKFELLVVSPTDIVVMVKNHCSNNNALEGSIYTVQNSALEFLFFIGFK